MPLKRKANLGAAASKAAKSAVPTKRGTIDGHAYCMLDATDLLTANPKAVAELLNHTARLKEANARAWAARANNDSKNSYVKIENVHEVEFAKLPLGVATLLENISATVREHYGTDLKLHIAANDGLSYTTSEHNDSAVKTIQVVAVVLD